MMFINIIYGNYLLADGNYQFCFHVRMRELPRCIYLCFFHSVWRMGRPRNIIPRGTGMIASSSTFCPHLGRVIRDLFRLLDAVYGIVRKH